MDMSAVISVSLSFLLSFFLWDFSKFLTGCYVKGRMLRSIMDKQGIPGPSESFNVFDIFSGKPDMKEISHDILFHVLPWMSTNIKLFGKVHLNWWIREPRIVITEPKIIWDLLIKKHENFIKSPALALLSDDIFDKGTFLTNGNAWAKQRRLTAPGLYINKVKEMLESMGTIATTVIERWESCINQSSKHEMELDVQYEFMCLNVDVVAKTAFNLDGSKTKEIVNYIHTLLNLMENQETWSWLPYARIIPFNINYQRWKVRKALNKLVRKQVKDRLLSRKMDGAREDDILDVLLDNQVFGITEDEIVAECKTLYGTGFISLAPLLSFTMLMLAIYPSWQQKARDEVEDVLKSVGKLDSNSVNHLKTLEMILRETMRLYPTMPFIARKCIKDTMLGDIFIPEGLGVTVPVLAVHHDRDLWGDDVHNFNPTRFENGTAAAAKHPMAFMPFSFGVRTCIGRVFSEMQCKLVLALIIQKFEIKPSPNYIHHPIIPGPLVPKHGMPVILKLRNV